MRSTNDDGEAPPRLEDIDVTTLSADADAARITDGGRYCPRRPVACVGRGAYGIVVPIRKDGREIVDEIPATYCPSCRAIVPDQRETA